MITVSFKTIIEMAKWIIENIDDHVTQEYLIRKGIAENLTLELNPKFLGVDGLKRVMSDKIRTDNLNMN